MAHKQNPFVKKMEAKYDEFYRKLFTMKMRMAMQIVQDAACFAAHDVFQMGPGRSVAFCESVIKYANEMAHLMNEDQNVDSDFEYTKAKVDEKLKRIVGAEHFVPWEKRYDR